MQAAQGIALRKSCLPDVYLIPFGLHSDPLPAYRRPDFRVDAALDAPSTVAGTNVNGKITGRYLYGGSMSNRDVRWK